MGNFIHLNQSYGTGEIVEISSEEATWALDILGSLFHELYERPVQEEARRQRFTEKQIEIGKMPKANSEGTEN